MKIVKKKIIIENMHCSSCALLIDGDLEELNGVKTATTNYAKGELDIEFDEELVTIDEIIKQIEKSGYRAKSK